MKLATLNIEGNKHLERVDSFLAREQPDVVCMQEVFDKDLKMFEQRFGYRSMYIPITKRRYREDDERLVVKQTTALLSRIPFVSSNAAYYYKPTDEIRMYRGDSLSGKRETVFSGMVWAIIEKDTMPYTIASTHFTWTPNGMPNEHQEKDMRELFKILDTIPEVVLCGDFNIPRGCNHLYNGLAKRYRDCVPLEITGTLDPELHRAGKDSVEGPKIGRFVVDYIFSTPEYSVRNVKKVSGISDHCALVADISRV